MSRSIRGRLKRRLALAVVRLFGRLGLVRAKDGNDMPEHAPCEACGYPVSANDDECPECGAEAPLT